MPNRKFKVPEPGTLVLAKGRWSLFTKAPSVIIKNYTSWPDGRGEVIELIPGQPLMFLETITCPGSVTLGYNKFVYKFLADGKVAYTVPTRDKPKKFLAQHVRIPKNKNERKTRS